jgi:hypothetical protein
MDSAEIRMAVINGIRNMSPYSSDPIQVGRYRGSEIGFCHRKMFFDRFVPVQKSTNLAMFQGSCLSTAIPSIVKATDSLKQSALEIPVESWHKSPTGRDFAVFGHADSVLAHDVFEWKFTGTSLASGDALPVYYFAQGNLYCNELRKPQFHVVMINRVSQAAWSKGEHVTVVSSDADVGAYQTMMDRVGVTHDCILTRRVPKKAPIADWECRDCRHKGMCNCFNDDDAFALGAQLGASENPMDMLTKGV